ncbi:MAG TPA: lytic murein transglycosylase, partial [Sneathiellales bacterium]|nr:lytic murein transglycosylase [Sneathiellales bacterium]
MGTKFTAMAMALLILTVWSTARADENSKFNTWLANLRSEALQSGIRTDIADAALSSIQPLPRVIELDRKQPEFTMTFDEYLGNVVPRSRVIKGLNKLAENRELLTKIGAQYGVQPRFIVAFWGIETDFGRHTGGFSVINALATLAFDGRRSAYFRKELLNALQILNDGHIAPNDMKGSWAGAMGQCQFMPSSFLNFAVDNDGDGRRDI